MAGVTLHQRPHGNSFSLGSLDIFETVLIRATQKPGILANKAMIAGHRIGDGKFQCMPQVGPAIDIRD
jgi:hypothetical protein